GVGSWSPDKSTQNSKWNGDNTVDTLFGAANTNSPFKSDGLTEELGEEDLVQLFAIYKKAGQLDEINKYHGQLDKLRAQLYPVAMGPKEKLDTAYKHIQHLERQPNHQTESYDK
ncbi:unnamed protein product, partial [Prorocentrum cordatum]